MTRAHTYDTMVLFQPHNEPYLKVCLSSDSEESESDDEYESLGNSVNAINGDSEWQKEESRRRRWEDKKRRSGTKAANAPLLEQEGQTSDSDTMPELEDIDDDNEEEMTALNGLEDRLQADT